MVAQILTKEEMDTFERVFNKIRSYLENSADVPTINRLYGINTLDNNGMLKVLYAPISRGDKMTWNVDLRPLYMTPTEMELQDKEIELKKLQDSKRFFLNRTEEQIEEVLASINKLKGK